MDNNDCEDSTQIEINITNTNANSQIVLNDLRLLELIYMYPYLFSKAVDPQDDKDYEEWGWEEIAKAFNHGYEGLQLSTPFSVEELRWRWDILRSICPLFTKQQDRWPKQLHTIMWKISKMMDVKPRANVKGVTPTQLFILNQLPFIEQLSPTLQRQLEVEVLDAIFSEEREGRSVCKSLGEKEAQLVQSDYDEFFKKICVKDLPKSITSISINRSNFNNLHCMPDPKHPQPEPEHTHPEPQSEPENPQPASEHSQPKPGHSQSKSEPPRPEPEPEPQYTQSEYQQAEPEHPQPEPEYASPEPPYLLKVEQQKLQSQSEVAPVQKDDLQMRYVPLKSAKHYVKRVQVRLKRLDLKDHLPMSNVRRKSKRRF